MNQIAYRSGYKYQLSEDYSTQVDIFPLVQGNLVNTEFFTLTPYGLLTVKKGYAWDGPSGPTIDTKTFMRGSLVHDVLYQMMREGYLEHETFREVVDRLLRKILKEDGMCAMRAWYTYWGVRWFADPCADPAHSKPILYAP